LLFVTFEKVTNKFVIYTLQETASLTDLNLMCNDIGPEGAEIIAKALQVNIQYSW